MSLQHMRPEALRYRPLPSGVNCYWNDSQREFVITNRRLITPLASEKCSYDKVWLTQEDPPEVFTIVLNGQCVVENCDRSRPEVLQILALLN